MAPRFTTMLARLAVWRGPPSPKLGSASTLTAPDAADEHGDDAARRGKAGSESCAVHVLLDDGLVHLEEGRLVLASSDGARRHMRIGDVAQLSLHGRAGVTSPAIRALMAQGVPLIWRNEAGKVAGMACDMSLRVTETRRAQFAAQLNPDLRLAIAAAFVSAKIDANRGLMRRRGASSFVLARLDALAEAATRASGVPQLLGVEGAAADLCFAQWPDLIAEADGFIFEGRRRRPPPDPVNALLSYAYAVLAGEAFAAALAAGLDPHAGFLHAERAGRPALALDLMEPLRPLVADRAVLAVINRREVKPEDFSSSTEHGVRLMPGARKALLGALEDRLNRPAPIRVGASGTVMSVREAMSEEAMALARALRNGDRFASRFGKR